MYVLKVINGKSLAHACRTQSADELNESSCLKLVLSSFFFVLRFTVNVQSTVIERNAIMAITSPENYKSDSTV